MTVIDRTIPPIVHTMGKLTMPSPTKVFNLPNGIPVTVYDDGRTPEVCRVSVVIDGGQAESPRPQLVEFMNGRLLDGTASLTPEQLVSTIDFNGAWLGFETHAHHRLVSMSLLNKRASVVLPLLAEMVFNPAFDVHNLAMEKHKFLHNLEIDRRKVSWRAATQARRMLYGADSVMGAEVDAEAFASLTREDLLSLHSSWLTRGSLHIYVGGRVTDDLLVILSQSFGNRQLPDGPGAGVEPIALSPVPQGTRQIYEMPDALQTGIVAFIPLPGRLNPDYNALRTVAVLLGGYFGSRLNSNIREDKGYTYGIGAALIGYQTAGWLRIACEADNRYVDGIIEEIAVEIDKLGRPESYSADEIARVKANIMLALAAQLDSPFEVLDYHIRKLTIGTGDEYFNAQQQAVNAMTPEFLAGLARRYLNPENLRFSLAGNLHHGS